MENYFPPITVLSVWSHTGPPPNKKLFFSPLNKWHLNLTVTHLLQRTGCHFRCVNDTGCHIFCVICFQCGFVDWIRTVEATGCCVCGCNGRLCGRIRLLVQRRCVRLTGRRIGLISGRTGYGDCGRMWIGWRWRRRTVRLRWIIFFNWIKEKWKFSLGSMCSIRRRESKQRLFSLFIILYDSISGLAAGTSLKSSSSLNHISSSSSNCRWSRR